jgi:hypothetical protein
VILIDTNVISETMRPEPEQRVVDWLDAQAAETLHISTVSMAELLLGIAILPAGRRKVELGLSLAAKAAALFQKRILPFDLAAARVYSTVVSRARSAGRPIGMADGQIAAIAASHKLTVATRDTTPFAAAGVATIDPWTAS